MTNPFELFGRLALVTGGGSGLGLAIARAIASAGAAVFLASAAANVIGHPRYVVGGFSASY